MNDSIRDSLATEIERVEAETGPHQEMRAFLPRGAFTPNRTTRR